MVLSICTRFVAPSDEPTSTIGIILIKLGIKYDLVGRDLDATKAPPTELVSTFQAIDAFTPDRVLVAAAGGRRFGTDAADLYIGGAGASDVNGGAGESGSNRWLRHACPISRNMPSMVRAR